MSLSNKEVVKKFAEGATKGKSCNMFIEDNILYDYGQHFPLLVRMPWGLLQNADRYSVTTSAHQGIASQYADVLIPFSCLRDAGINPVEQWSNEVNVRVELIDKTRDRWDITGYKKWSKETKKYDKRITVSEYNHLSHEEKFAPTEDGKGEYNVWDKIEERRTAACVLKVDNDYYLSSMDGQNYFLSLLPKPVKTVSEAFDELKPKEAIGKEGKDYLRQGEWFFIPASYNVKTHKGEEVRAYQLPQRNGDTGHHTVTRAKVILGIPYVRGTVRHSNKDHRMLKLDNGKTWYMAIESNHVRSWGARGKVD